MKSDKQFNSFIEYSNSFANDIPNEQIKNEPMFFNSSIEFAWDKGGPITRSFIEALPQGWKSDVVFDSRAHMLMPGWYPAIPGWHHDDVPRAVIPPGQHFITAGQPDYDSPRYRSEHIMGLVNATVCPTQFAVGLASMKRVPDGELIYRQWHEEVKTQLNDGTLQLIEAPDRRLVKFDCETFHQGQNSKGHGWRWFGRVSKFTDRVNSITNEIRAQVQVYLEFPMEGW